MTSPRLSGPVSPARRDEATKGPESFPVVLGVDSLYLGAYVELDPILLGEWQGLRRILGRRAPQVSEELAAMALERADDPAWLDAGVSEVVAEARERVEALETAREDEGELLAAIEVNGRTFEFMPFSVRKRFHVTLECEDFRLHVRLGPPSAQMPNVYCEIRSAFLWAGPWDSQAGIVLDFLGDLGEAVREPQVSRCDVAWDVQGLGPALEYDQFVSRATTRLTVKRDRLKVDFLEALRSGAAGQVLHDARSDFLEMLGKLQDVESSDLEDEDRAKAVDRVLSDEFTWYFNQEVQQLTWGTRGGRAPLLRAYRKDRRERYEPDAKRCVMGHVYEAAGLEAGELTWRFEFELSREFFRSSWFGEERIETVSDLVRHFGDLARYLIGTDEDDSPGGGWCRMHRNDATRGERANTHPAWQAMRQAVRRPRRVTVERDRIHEHLAEVYAERAVAALAQMVALLRTDAGSLHHAIEGLLGDSQALYDLLAEELAKLNAEEIKAHVHQARRLYESGRVPRKGRTLATKLAVVLAQRQRLSVA